MKNIHVESTRREEWNSLVSKEPRFALLQSWEWGEFKEKLGWKVFRIAVEENNHFLGGAQMLIKPFPLGFASLAYIPKGPIGDWQNQDVFSILFSELHRIAEQHNAIFLKIEPPTLNSVEVDKFIRQNGFKASIYTNQPRATIVLDLTQSLDEILRQMRKKTRMYIRSASEKGVSIRFGAHEDLPAFYEMMVSTAQREEFSPRVFDYYEEEWQILKEKNQTALLMASYQEHLLVVRMICRFGEHAAAFHSGSTKEKEFADLHANNLLVWEAIKWAKEQGCKTYDFWGIPDEVGQAVFDGQPVPVSERNDGLWGVYRFKSGFCKNIVYYIGAYDYVYKPVLYKLMTNRFINSSTLEYISSWLDSLASKMPGHK